MDFLLLKTLEIKEALGIVLHISKSFPVAEFGEDQDKLWWYEDRKQMKIFYFSKECTSKELGHILINCGRFVGIAKKYPHLIPQNVPKKEWIAVLKALVKATA